MGLESTQSKLAHRPLVCSSYKRLGTVVEIQTDKINTSSLVSCCGIAIFKVDPCHYGVFLPKRLNPCLLHLADG